MIEVVRKLQEQGHKVEYYIRKDGGILIRRIDSQRFTSGASGNIMARSMAGVEISEARSSQLKYATRAKKQLRKFKNVAVKDELKLEWQRVKKKWNKAFKAKGGKPHQAGYFSWAGIKYTFEKYGDEEAYRRIREAEKYASGIAYEKNVRELSIQIQFVADKIDSNELRQVAQELLDNAYMIKESWIKPAYEKLYQVNAGVSANQIAQDLRRILRLQ